MVTVVAVIAMLTVSVLGVTAPARAATASGGTLTSGQAVTATFAAAADAVSYQVQLPPGQTLSLVTTAAASVTGPQVQALLDVVDASGSPTFTSTSLIGNAVGDTGYVSVGVASSTAQSLTVTLTGVDAGALTFTAWVVGAPTLTPIVLGAPTVATLGVPGQAVALSATAPSGVFGLRLSRAQFSDTRLVPQGGDGFTWAFTDAAGLPARITTLAAGVSRAEFSGRGPFTLTLSGVGAATGSVTVEVSSIQDVVLAPTLGTAQTVSLPTVWSAPRISGLVVPTGGRVRVDVLSSTLKRADGSAGSARISIGGQDVGAVTATPATFGSERTFGSASGPLIQVSSDGLSTGDVILVISLVPADASRTLVVGQPTVVALPNAFQNAFYALAIQAGDRFEIRVTGNTMTQPVRIGLGTPSPFGAVNPLLAVPAQADGWAELSDAYTGFGVGTQSLFVDPEGAGSGSLTLIVRRLSDVVTALPIGTAVMATATSGDRLVFDFPGGATGRRPVLAIDTTALRQLTGLPVVPETPTDPNSPAVTPVPGAAATVEQNGVTILQLSPRAPRLSYLALDTTAEFDPSRPWRLVVDPTLSSTGQVGVRLLTPVVTTVAVRSGTRTAVRIPGPGDTTRLTFRPATGQRIVVETSGATTALQFSLETATGSQLALTPADPYLELGVAASAVPLVLVVRSQDAGATGTASVTVRLVDDPVTALGEGQTAARWTVGQNPRLTFTADAGQRPILDVSSTVSSGGQPVPAVLLGPDGFLVGSFPDLQPGRSTFAEFPVPVSVRGRYTVVLDPPGAAVGSATVRLRWQQQVNRTVALGARTTVGVDAPGTNVALSVTVPEGVQLQWGALGSTFAAATLRLLDATGAEYASVALPVGDSSGLLPGFALGAGTYRVVVDPEGRFTGTVRLTLTAAPA